MKGTPFPENFLLDRVWVPLHALKIRGDDL